MVARRRRPRVMPERLEADGREHQLRTMRMTLTVASTIELKTSSAVRMGMGTSEDVRLHASYPRILTDLRNAVLPSARRAATE